MKTMIHYAFVLLAISAVACAILALVNNQTAPLIAENKVKAELEARQAMFPDAVITFIDKDTTTVPEPNPINDDPPIVMSEADYRNVPRRPTKFYDPTFVYYEAHDAEGNLLGYILDTEGKGYGSTIKVMVGVTTDYTIQKVKILEQQETPGLGTNCEKPEFLQRFIGKKPGRNDIWNNGWFLRVDKDGGDIQSISGATITSRAVTKAIKTAVDKLIARTYVYIPSEDDVDPDASIRELR